MSGRLTILPKKSYCPWNPENVERVLRDERLERERLEKDQNEKARAEDERRRRRREGEDGTTTDGHVNLFPEAKDAELRLARGLAPKPGGASTIRTEGSGVLPVPLGGEEAAKRKMGAVPFYMRPQNHTEEGKYDNASGSFRLGARIGRTHAAAADEITSKITSDQYDRREDSRKAKMDPTAAYMNMSDRVGPGSSTNIPCVGEKSHPEISRAKSKCKKHRSKRRKRSRRMHEDESLTLSSDSCSSHSFDSSSSSPRLHRRRSNKSHSHSQKKSPSCSDDKNSHRKKPKRKRDRESESRRRRRRHRSASPDSSNRDSTRGSSGAKEQFTKSDTSLDELEERRRRRRAREAREMVRERQVLLPTSAFDGSVSAGRGGMRYQDQFNPSLSRN
ncbi:hypothetical protein ACHAWF_001129 [Thalassiosira exigua]